MSLSFHIKSIHRLLIIHLILITTKIMDNHTTTSSSKLSTSNDNSKTTNEMSSSTSTSIVGIPSSTADHTSIMPSIITQSWLNEHIQKVVSAQVSKLSEVIPLCPATTDQNLLTSNPPPLKRSKTNNIKIKEYRFRGCKNTEADVEIKQRACPDHFNILRLENNAQKKNAYHEKNNHLPSNYMFDIGSSLVNNKDFIKCESFYTKVLMKTSFTKGKMVGITSSSASIYTSLKKMDTLLYLKL